MVSLAAMGNFIICFQSYSRFVQVFYWGIENLLLLRHRYGFGTRHNSISSFCLLRTKILKETLLAPERLGLKPCVFSLWGPQNWYVTCKIQKYRWELENTLKAKEKNRSINGRVINVYIENYPAPLYAPFQTVVNWLETVKCCAVFLLVRESLGSSYPKPNCIV